MAAGPLEDAIAHVTDQDIAPETPATPPVTFDDPDAAELAAALAEAEAEKAKAGAETDPDAPTPGEETTEPTTEPSAETKDKGPVPMIPKPRLDEVIREREEAQRRAAFLEGQLEATKELLAKGTQSQTPQAPQQREPTAEEKVGQAEQAIIDLAKKFDSGELTYADMKTQEFRLQGFINNVREQALLAKVPTPAPQNDPLYLDTLTAQLEKDHPDVLLFTSDRDFNYLVAVAKEKLEEKGIVLDNSDMGKFRLRQEIAKQATELAPRFYPGQAAKPAATTPPAPSAAAAARANKLALQETMPPDLSSVTGSTPTDLTPSAASFEQMSDEEILAALPKAARNKFLGVTSS